MIEGQEGVSWEDWLALAKACEAHGVPALFRSDHYLNLGGEPRARARSTRGRRSTRWPPSPRTLRLGTLVSPATFRHPSELAKVVTTADHVSGGRVELGLGAGWHEARAPRLRLPVPADARAHGPARRAARDRARHVDRGAVLVLRRALHARGPRRAAAPGADAAPAADHGRRRRAAQRRAGRPLGGRVQHAVRVARRGPRAQGDDRRGVRGGGPRADPVLADDRLPGRAATARSCASARPRSPTRWASRSADADAWLASPPEAWIVGTVDEVAEQLARAARRRRARA